MPKRIQRKRTKGWRLPPNTVCVTRPGFWGNPFRVGVHGDAGECIEKFRDLMAVRIASMPDLFVTSPQYATEFSRRLRDLRGKDLACFCPLEKPCHADVLLEIANR